MLKSFQPIYVDLIVVNIATVVRQLYLWGESVYKQ